MIKSQRSKLQLKKLIQQQTLISQLDHPLSIQSRFSPLELPNNDPLDMNMKFIDCTFNLDINSKFTQNLQLKLQSRVINNEIDCLQLQSKIKEEDKNLFHQFIQQPQLIKSSQSQKQISQQKPLIKVHSSIDGMQISKKQYKQASLPISDLILSDNMYMKLSSRLNQHQSFSSREENQHLSNLFLENLKIQKQQNIQLTSLLQTEIKLLQMKFLQDTIKDKINALQSSIDKLKLNLQLSPISISSDYFTQRTHKSKSRTPQNIKISTPKSNNLPRTLMNRKNILENKIKNQNQKIKQQKDKSVKVVQKLSQAKSHYQKITDKLNLYSTRLNNNQNEKSPKYSKPISPLSERCKSPSRKSNIRKKYDQFLRNQMMNYHKTLKNHYLVIHEQIETFQAYQTAKIEQLKEQINLLKSQIRFIEVKSVGKLIFGDNQKQPLQSTKLNEIHKKNISPNAKTFQSNFSQNIIRTVSPIPSLSPRTPQMYSKSPQTFRNSPQLTKRYTDIYTKSPKIYSKSPYYCNKQFDIDIQGSMTPRSIKIKDINILKRLDDTKSISSKQSTHKQIMRKKQHKLQQGLKDNHSYQVKLNQRNKKTERGKENVKFFQAKNQEKSNKDIVKKRFNLLKSEKIHSQFTSPNSKTSIQMLR